MTRYEHILQTLKGLHQADLICLWNDRCEHHSYYGDWIHGMESFDEIEEPLDPDLSFSEQIASIKIAFENFNANDDFYIKDDLGHYYSFNSLSAKGSPFDMDELAKDIDEYADYYYRADSICYLDDFEWLYEELIETF